MSERLVQQAREASIQTNRGGTTACTAHAATSEEAVKTLRNEMSEDIARVQAQLAEVLNAARAKMQMESDGKTGVMLQRLKQV